MMPAGQIKSVNPGVTGTEKENAVVLRAEDIRAGYGKKEVLHGVTLEVRRGEIVALAGANGAGKSTLLKVIAGLLQPYRGAVFFDGTNVTGLEAHQRSRLGITYLLQGAEVFPSLTVQENLEMALREDHGEETALSAMMDMFPVLRSKRQYQAELLSGGERQMLALGMVFIRGGRLLLLDEPTAALAPIQAAEALRRLADYSRSRGLSIVLVEQRLRQALSIADRAILLVSGNTAGEIADPSAWLRSEQYERDLLSRFFSVGAQAQNEFL